MRPPDADPRSFSTAAHVALAPGPPRHRMGLRPVGDGPWLEPDEHRRWQLDEKDRLLAADRDRFVQSADGAAARAGVAALVALVDHEVAATGTDIETDSRTDSDAGTDARRTPSELVADGEEPIIACGRATQEDWCVMVREDDWRLRAACVCFPSRWVLSHKLGATIAEIHQPVPRYPDELGGLVERFFDRLGEAKVVWRTNWNVWDDARLSQPFTEADAPRYDPVPLDEVGDHTFLRVERQTLRRLTPDAIAFSIRVHQRPLAHLRAEPGGLDALRAAVAHPDLRAKKLGHLAAPVAAWIASA